MNSLRPKRDVFVKGRDWGLLSLQLPKLMLLLLLLFLLYVSPPAAAYAAFTSVYVLVWYTAAGYAATWLLLMLISPGYVLCAPTAAYY